MKTLKILFMLIIIYSGCNSSNNGDEEQKGELKKLIRIWVRIGDVFKGAKVIVEYDKENKLQGWLGYVPDSMSHWGFKQYELKWLDIKAEGNNQYSFRNLAKLIHPGWLGYSSEYRRAKLYFINKDTICIESLSGDKKIDVGLKQYWVKWKDIY